MRIFVLPEDIAKKEGIKLNADKSHYLISVLRCKKGDVITIIDGKGKAYEAEVAEIAKGNVLITVINEIQLDTESSLNLILCQGILKGEKMDLVIQKTTELGVKEIIPLITERCVVKETRKVKRWQKIAEEAAEQCGRTVIPTVHEPIEYRNALCVMSDEYKKFLLTHHDLPITDYGLNGFIFWEEGGLALKEAIKKLLPSPSLHNSNTPIFVFVGPEGGFTAEEVKLSEEHGLIRTTLGKRTLRAETAAIVSVALVQFLLES
ncbi:MAG: 16S rRNA (uracil(1498)-N(3))-methyltransferase [Nitrospirota bacterium]